MVIGWNKKDMGVWISSCQIMYAASCDVIENIIYLELRRELKNVRF
jgi:hypothetical protein